MQIRIEAHLILNINTSVSAFAMTVFPPSTSCHSLLVFASGQRRMRVWDQNWVAAPLKSVSDEGGSILVEIQKLQQCDTVRECPLFPVLLLRIWMLGRSNQIHSWCVTELFFFNFFFFGYKFSISLGSELQVGVEFCAFPPPVWLVATSLAYFNTWSRHKITACRMHFSGV